MDITNSHDQQVLIAAVANALPIVREFIGGHLPDDPSFKIVGEEGTEVGEGQLALLIDPLDGTRAFSSGLATSTTILGAYDSTEKQVVGCVVGEVATGRVWSAFGDSPTQLRHRKAVSVWPKPMDEQSTVFLDVSHGFARNHRVILSDAQMARLFGQLNGEFKLSIPGSNGLIQALVANGGQKVAGSITSAIGGPWDVCGVKLVLNAGGFAKAFHLGQDQDKCWLEERDPLNVMDYDILICGNELHTVLTLLEGLRRAL